MRRLWRITPCLIGTSYVPFGLRAGSPSNNSLVSTSNSRFLLLCSVLLSWKAQDLLSSSWSVPNLRENGKWRKGENPYLPTKYTVDAIDKPWHEQKSLVGSVRYGISPQTVRHGYCTQNRRLTDRNQFIRIHEPTYDSLIYAHTHAPILTMFKWSNCTQMGESPKIYPGI